LRRTVVLGGVAVLAAFVAWALLIPSVTIQGDCPPPPFPAKNCPSNAAGYLTDHRLGTRLTIIAVGIVVAIATIIAGLFIERSARGRHSN
jgi:hypothetical protein